MGRPIKIIDLAKVLISYFSEDIDITITKMRPGEKLHEDIVSDNESLMATSNKDILHVKSKKSHSQKPLDLGELLKITPYSSASKIKSTLKKHI